MLSYVLIIISQLPTPQPPLPQGNVQQYALLHLPILEINKLGNVFYNVPILPISMSITPIEDALAIVLHRFIHQLILLIYMLIIQHGHVYPYVLRVIGHSSIQL